MTNLLLLYLIIAAVASVFSFVAYGWDKRQARLGGRRVSEQNLHMMALLGGWPGALAGQQVFRHKTQKTSFRVTFFLIVALHVAILAGLIYLLMRETPSA